MDEYTTSPCTVQASPKLWSSDRGSEIWWNYDHVERVIALCKHATIEIHCNQHEFTLTTAAVPHKGTKLHISYNLQEMTDTKKNWIWVQYYMKQVQCRPTTVKEQHK